MTSNAVRASVKKNGIYLVAVWTIIIGLLASVTIYAHHNDTIKEAESEANTYFKLNLSYREWVSKMGGVYVSTDKVAPNPHLQVPNRDVTTSDNRRLTLVNPAYMTRMVFDSIQASSSDPIINKITSLKPLNPANAPDEWERQSLVAFERQQYKERSEVTTIDGKPYLRFISMFLTEESCLKCHAHQGYRTGDVRGAITISVPLTKSFELQQRTDNKILGGYFVLWMLGTIGIVISSRRREHVEKIMSDSENRYRSLFHKAGEGICIMSQQGDLINVNEAFAKCHGYEVQEMLGMNIRDLDVHGGVEENPDRAQLLMSGKTIEFEVEHYHKNGHIFPLDVKVSLISLGTETFALCFHRDITERKWIELEREQYHTFFNISSDLMCIANITGNFVKMNSVWEKTLGYSEEELSSKPFIDFVHPDDVENTLAVVQNNLLLGIPVFSFENRYLCKDGTYKWLSWTSNPIPEEGITYAIARDITDRKQLELEREQFYTFFNNSSDLMCIADPNGAFKKTNPAFTEILGYSTEELISKPFINFVHPDDKQSTLDEMARGNSRSVLLLHFRTATCVRMAPFAGYRGELITIRTKILHMQRLGILLIERRLRKKNMSMNCNCSRPRNLKVSVCCLVV
ncbi:MAG: PAS domain S-box protein [Desulfuromonadales bacterium]